MSGVPRRAQGPESQEGILPADNTHPVQEGQPGTNVQGRSVGLQMRHKLPPIWLTIRTWVCTKIFLGCVDVQASCAHSVTTGWRDYLFGVQEPPPTQGWLSWAWNGIVRCITSIVGAVFIILVVLLFCLALFMALPHVAQGCSWLLERLSAYALLFSENSKLFSGYLETKSHTVYNSSVSAWHDFVFLRSLQSHEKHFIQRMRDGQVKNSTELEEELTAAKNHATDLEAKLETAEKLAKDLKGELATTKKHAIDLERKLATANQHASNLEAKLDTAEKLTKDLRAHLDNALKDYGCSRLVDSISNTVSQVSGLLLTKPWEE